MAEPEQLIVICEKCGARLKLKPIQAKILNEVKCGKCGNRIPTSKAVPASAAPPSVAAPLSEIMGKTAEPKSETPPPPPPPEPVEPPPPEPAAAVAEPPPSVVPTPAVPAEPARAPTPPPTSRTGLIKSRTANFGMAPGLPVTTSGEDSPARLKKRIHELEDEVNVFRQQIFTLEGQIAKQQEESGRFQELLQRAADAEERAAELKDMWYQKEKEYHALEAKAEQIAHERDDAYAARDVVINDIKDLLATYHAAEVEAARKRLTDLDDRMERFVTLIRQRNAPPPPSSIGDAGATQPG